MINQREIIKKSEEQTRFLLSLKAISIFWDDCFGGHLTQGTHAWSEIRKWLFIQIDVSEFYCEEVAVGGIQAV